MSKQGQQHTRADSGGQRPPKSSGKTSGQSPEAASPGSKGPQQQQQQGEHDKPSKPQGR